MKKVVILAVVAAFVVLTACGAMSESIVLPEAEDLDKVTVIWPDDMKSSSDSAYIARLLEAMRGAKSTGAASVQDVPNGGEWLARVDFSFKEGGASTLFVYPKGGKLLLEQPYQGIYEADRSLRALLREVEH